jgi:acyl-CoA reductase-like NAD-dependent aldehyde dehydrogenase
VITLDKLFIGGRWTAPAGTGVIEVRSPHDQSPVGRVPEATTADVDRAVAAAREAFDHGPWPHVAPEERQRIVKRFNELHAARTTELASLITSENGSPIWFTGLAQASLAGLTDAFLTTARDYPWEERLDTSTGPAIIGGPAGDGDPYTLVRREPVGVVAAIIPWNAPHQSALVKLIPALLAGCTVVLKPSPETAVDGVLLGEIFAEAGFPDGVVSILPADREVSEYLVAHPGVDKIAFTGSTAAGRRIASIAGQQLKRVSLELGGKSAAVVLDDADLDAVTAGLRFASFANNGEACTAHTRILAPRSRYDDVVAALATMVEGLAVGDPADPDTFIGPMVKAEQQQRIQSYLDSGIEQGARVVVGGPGVPDKTVLEKGFYVRPTVFADVDNGMRIAQEEIFGPVVAVIPYDGDEDAIRIANDSPYGLGGGVWTRDRERGLTVARAIRTGTFLVNGGRRAGTAPFGGFKASGIGREYGPVGLGQYVEYKSISL